MNLDCEIYINPITIVVCSNNWDLVYFIQGRTRTSRRCEGHNVKKPPTLSDEGPRRRMS